MPLRPPMRSFHRAVPTVILASRLREPDVHGQLEQLNSAFDAIFTASVTTRIAVGHRPGRGHL